MSTSAAAAFVHSVARLRQLQAHYVSLVSKCDDAIELLLTIDKQERRAEKLVGAVTAATTGAPVETRRPGRPKGAASKARKATRHSTAAANRKNRADAEAGTRPIDRLRAVFATAKPGVVMTPADASELAGIDFSRANLALTWMRRRREIRRTKGGWVALRGLQRPAANNGASGAEA